MHTCSSLHIEDLDPCDRPGANQSNPVRHYIRRERQDSHSRKRHKLLAGRKCLLGSFRRRYPPRICNHREELGQDLEKDP
jgi:hypothetical protein